MCRSLVTSGGRQSSRPGVGATADGPRPLLVRLLAKASDGSAVERGAYGSSVALPGHGVRSSMGHTSLARRPRARTFECGCARRFSSLHCLYCTVLTHARPRAITLTSSVSVYRLCGNLVHIDQKLLPRLF